MQNSKLVERGIRILMNACNIDRVTAVETIKSAGRSVPVALVMLKAKVDKPEAVRRLAKSDGNVRVAIDDKCAGVVRGSEAVILSRGEGPDMPPLPPHPLLRRFDSFFCS